ncbi:hypothetical protein PQQ51_21755 [Paraburkholderia xenovorans]|uniref:hypothetical protein n=1 Tax=Paraburkholderia xenovorans TaxID=36873 RepID=UPI0038B969BD
MLDALIGTARRTIGPLNIKKATQNLQNRGAAPAATSGKGRDTARKTKPPKYFHTSAGWMLQSSKSPP